MSRYLGPRVKKMRALGVNLPGLSSKTIERKPHPPGQHGPNRRRKVSDFGMQLAEKQKAKYTYGILEKQFSNMFKQANARPGITGEILLQFCESRLDNVVFRLGISNSRRGARQFVTHRHIMVNGHVVNIPSYRLRPGDVVAVREKSKSMTAITSALGSAPKRLEWLDWNTQNMSGTFISIPTREQIPENIKESLIVELYSK